MKRFAMSVLLGATLFASMATGASASYWEHPDQTIRVNGHEYYGRWAYIGERPYVNVESFGKALGVPRRHNAKNWYLGESGGPSGSPFQMLVESGKFKLPTVRFGGATYVDLIAACEALKIPYHRDFDNRFLEVGDAYQGEYMIGAWERFVNGKTGASYEGMHGHTARGQEHLDMHSGKINHDQ